MRCGTPTSPPRALSMRTAPDLVGVPVSRGFARIPSPALRAAPGLRSRYVQDAQGSGSGWPSGSSTLTGVTDSTAIRSIDSSPTLKI